MEESHRIALLAESERHESHERTRYSILLRPKLTRDGSKWCALYGENLQDGVAGFGDTPDAALRAFDQAFFEKPAGPELLIAKAEGGQP